MSDYRRCRIAGGTYFFTVCLADRGSDLLVRHVAALRRAVTETHRLRPFHVDGWVVLPEHLHCIWTLPLGDADFSNRWKAIKIRFVQALPAVEHRSPAQVARGARAIWQRRFWEHAIRDEEDFARHLDYLHFNPVKHGWAKTAAAWPHSTFGRWVAAGTYPADWGGEAVGNVEAGEQQS